MYTRPNRAGPASLLVLALLASACGGPEPEPSPPCEQKCQDGAALRSLRETLKLVFNLTLQSNQVGAQDETTACPMGGSARVFGQATSNAIQGSNEVELTYELMQCAYLQRDDEPPENYNMTLSGTVLQEGTIAVQPSVTTALNMSSESLTFSGNVYDPPLDYHEEACPVRIGQNGNQVSGTICDREAGVDL
jgi:hypothetical protein